MELPEPFKSSSSFILRPLGSREDLPFRMLLLADETMEAINRYITKSDIFVVENNQIVIAVIVLTRQDKETLEIKNVAVDITYQGRGLGTCLINAMADYAGKRGFTSLLIGTGDHSVKQLRLYERLGFERSGIISDFYPNNYPQPIYEDGAQLKDMVILKRKLSLP